LSSSSGVTISLFDVLGRRIAQLENANASDGKHKSYFDTHKLANGVYVVQIRAGLQAASQKIAVVN